MEKLVPRIHNQSTCVAQVDRSAESQQYSDSVVMELDVIRIIPHVEMDICPCIQL